ncbi:MAG TPA: methyl-accepting chemotaxis protein [Thermoleophilaceae bacterium]|nr:methyl-accepting chemotaxis protein [Thermoleophilaceae bacterium]
MVRTFWLIAAILGISLLPLGYAFEHQSKANSKAALGRSLEQASAQEASALENYFERARSVTLISAHNPAFSEFYSEPGSLHQRVAAGGQILDEANSALGYLETLFPGIIGEACFIDRNGPEVARVVRGKRAPVSDLSPDESGNPFFKPTFALPPGQVYQAKPYVSPDTNDWVVSNSTPLASPRGAALVHFEVSVDGFRQEAARNRSVDIMAVDARTGYVVFNSRLPQKPGGKLGQPKDHRFVALVRQGKASGTTTVGGKLAAFTHLPRTPHNANDWYIIAMQRAGVPAPTAGGSSAGILIIAGLIALAGLGLVGVLIRKIVRRIRSYADFAEQVTEGDLTARLNADGSDELAALGRSLNHMVEGLAEISGQVRAGAQQIGVNSSGILSSVEQNSRSTTEQSAAVQEVTATVEEVRANAEQAARKAEEVADQARTSMQVSGEGAAAVQAIAHSMDDISDKVGEIASDIQALSDRTEQISEITETVNELADQSSLLALNAAIEAARAGEQGKGFAVVADEVRKMAEQSKQATAQVETILADIQAAVHAAVQKSGEGTEVVRHGHELAARAGEIISQLAEAIRSAADAADEITASAGQQSVGMDQIAHAMRQTEAVTSNLASEAEQSRTAAAGLDEVARELEQLTGRYTLKPAS